MYSVFRLKDLARLPLPALLAGLCLVAACGGWTDTANAAKPTAAITGKPDSQSGPASPSSTDTGTAQPVIAPGPDPAVRPASQPKLKPKEIAQAALARAAAKGKYLLLFCFRTEDDTTREMRKVFARAVRRLGSRAISASMNITDPAELLVVQKFGLDRAPMPLALVVAANGAVTGGFPVKFTVEQISNALVSAGLANCLKALQAGKLVLLCLQNATTQSNDAAMRGVRDFKADARYTRLTEIVSIDPADPAESKFMAQLKIDAATPDAVTAFLAPPGTVICKFSGATTKDKFIAALATCGTGGCAPSGCGPTK